MLADALKAVYNRGRWRIALRGLFGTVIGAGCARTTHG